jgi:hypothetical protein
MFLTSLDATAPIVPDLAGVFPTTTYPTKPILILDASLLEGAELFGVTDFDR